MAIEKGNVSIEAENIMPIIKRWLYSDKDIFLREVVSNGCDAITKFRMMNPGTEEDLRVTVTVDKEKGEIRITDTGIGMTGDEVCKYINQVAFSGAQEFLKNHQSDKENEPSDIIGHFGLGFYSVFMVSDKVVIDSLSCTEGAAPVRWESDDGMSFELTEGDHAAHGTTITLHISEDEKEFLELYRVREVLQRYCGYMNSPVYLEDANAKPVEKPAPEPKEGEEKAAPVIEMPKPQLINDVAPLWLKKPADCKDEDYKSFYHKMFTDYDDPLFWIHLNVDYPFNLKGILYFPKLKQDFGTREGQVKLFSGQVFVADNIKEVIPEFLLLLKGVIDCPDLPLNVSRSFLQNDGYVRKISAYITKKVGDKLVELFNGQRKTYEGYWNDISPFIKYGCIKDAKFYDSVKNVLLLKTTKDEYLTFAEYKDRNGAKLSDAVPADKTEDEKKAVARKVFYTNDAKRQAASVDLYTQRGIDVAVMDTIIDSNFMSFMEYSGGDDSVSFARVDADVSGLTQESDEGKDLDADALQKLFRDALDKQELNVKLESLASTDMTAMVTEDEQSRRFKEMSRLYGESFPMPDRFTLVLNRRNATIQSLAAREAGDVTTLLCKQVYDLARMAAQPLENDEITAFINRSQKLVGMLAQEK